MSLDHQTIVHHSVLGEAELADSVAEHDAGHDGRAGGAETASERDGVVDVNMGVRREGALVVALEDVESGAGDEVVVGEEGDFGGAVAGVGDGAVEGGEGKVGLRGDGELEPDGE